MSMISVESSFKDLKPFHESASDKAAAVLVLVTLK